METAPQLGSVTIPDILLMSSFSSVISMKSILFSWKKGQEIKRFTIRKWTRITFLKTNKQNKTKCISLTMLNLQQWISLHVSNSPVLSVVVLLWLYPPLMGGMTATSSPSRRVSSWLSSTYSSFRDKIIFSAIISNLQKRW